MILYIEKWIYRTPTKPKSMSNPIREFLRAWVEVVVIDNQKKYFLCSTSYLLKPSFNSTVTISYWVFNLQTCIHTYQLYIDSYWCFHKYYVWKYIILQIICMHKVHICTYMYVYMNVYINIYGRLTILLSFVSIQNVCTFHLLNYELVVLSLKICSNHIYS